MQNIQHSQKVTLSTAIDAVFDACRANPGRLPRAVGTYRAKFNACADGESHIVMISDQAGEVIASARVDGFDADMIVALFVEKGGIYAGLDGVEPWDESMDARNCREALPAVAHPPCQRWGRFWHGSTRKPHQFKLGADGGCFASALAHVRAHGGVIEHPMDSHAWAFFKIPKPTRRGGWIPTDDGGWTCCVYQGHYGHVAGKGTWLLAYGMTRSTLPEFTWGPTPQRIHPRALELHGYEKARKIGMIAMIGGKDKTALRDATTPQFRDALIAIARTAWRQP